LWTHAVRLALRFCTTLGRRRPTRPKGLADGMKMQQAIPKSVEPPGDLQGQELTNWLSTKPESVTVTRDGKEITLTGEALARWKYQRYMRDYLATVQSVDDNIGRLLGFLDTAGLARNTIVIYTSDQGFFLGEHGLFDKRFMYEESLRMPFLMRHPPSNTSSSPTVA